MAVGETALMHWDSESQDAIPVGSGIELSGAFKAFIPGSIEGWNPDVGAAVIKRVKLAEQALRQYKCNRWVPHNMDWMLRHVESAASGAIGGTPYPSPLRIARAEAKLDLLGQKPPRNVIQALWDISALNKALDIAGQERELEIEDIASIHRALLSEEEPDAGNFRTDQNWVGPSVDTPLDAVYVAPPAEAVDALMDDLVRRVNNPLCHPLIELGVVHAQFEMIRPFQKGNGRVGRALMQLMIQRSELTPLTVLPISSFLGVREFDYKTGLANSSVVCQPDDRTRALAMQPWLALAAESVLGAMKLARNLEKRIDEIGVEWARAWKSAGLTNKPSASDSLTRRVIRHPILSVEKAAELTGVTEPTAKMALDRLRGLGIVRKQEAGGRRVVYEAGDIINVFMAATKPSPADFGVRNTSCEVAA